MGKLSSEYSARSSWSGYMYQGYCGIYYALDFIKERLERAINFTNCSLIYERNEDFEILEGDIIKSINQVKKYRNRPTITKLDKVHFTLLIVEENAEVGMYHFATKNGSTNIDGNDFIKVTIRHLNEMKEKVDKISNINEFCSLYDECNEKGTHSKLIRNWFDNENFNSSSFAEIQPRIKDLKIYIDKIIDKLGSRCSFRIDSKINEEKKIMNMRDESKEIIKKIRAYRGIDNTDDYTYFYLRLEALVSERIDSKDEVIKITLKEILDIVTSEIGDVLDEKYINNLIIDSINKNHEEMQLYACGCFCDEIDNEQFKCDMRRSCEYKRQVDSINKMNNEDRKLFVRSLLLKSSKKLDLNRLPNQVDIKDTVLTYIHKYTSEELTQQKCFNFIKDGELYRGTVLRESYIPALITYLKGISECQIGLLFDKSILITHNVNCSDAYIDSENIMAISKDSREKIIDPIKINAIDVAEFRRRFS